MNGLRVEGMDRRHFLGLATGVIGGLAGCATNAADTDDSADTQPTTTTVGPWCNDGSGGDYRCHNHDAGADGLDTYYIKAWTGDAENEEEEDQSNDIYAQYTPYFDYSNVGIRGTVENLTDEAFERVYVETAFYADDQKTVVVDGEDYIGTIEPGLTYRYDIPMFTNFAGEFSVFEFWVNQM